MITSAYLVFVRDLKVGDLLGEGVHKKVTDVNRVNHHKTIVTVEGGETYTWLLTNSTVSVIR